MPTGLLIGLVVLGISVALPPIVGWINRLRGKHDPLERAIEQILVRKGVLPEAPQTSGATGITKSEDSPPDTTFYGELYRVVTTPKNAFADITRQMFESMHREFVLDIDVLVELYIVNQSNETQYIRDFCVSVEIDGKRIELRREEDFDAWDINGVQYEYCLDPEPDAGPYHLEQRGETLRPIFTSLPAVLAPKQPLEGWVRFLLEGADPKKLEENRTYAFMILDSLGREHELTRSKRLTTSSRIKAWKKRGHK